MRLTEELLQTLVAGSSAVPLNRRANVALLHEGKVGQRVPCLIRELSETGAGLLSVRALPQGTDFVLWLKDGSGNEVGIKCLAMHCEAGGSGCLLHGVEASFQCMYGATSQRQSSIEQIRAAILN